MSVFLGWMPDAATQAALANLQQRIRAALPANAPRHDWRRPAQWHMTLRYLGESIDALQQVLINKIQTIDEIQSTETLIVLQNPIMRTIKP